MINRHASADICAASSVRILDVTQLLYFSKSAGYLICLKITSKSENQLLSMKFKGRCAIKLCMVYRNWSCRATCHQKLSIIMVQPQLVKIGGPWTQSMIRGSNWTRSMKGCPRTLSIFWWTWSMDLVHRGGPWTRGLCFVLSPPGIRISITIDIQN